MKSIQTALIAIGMCLARTAGAQDTVPLEQPDEASRFAAADKTPSGAKASGFNRTVEEVVVTAQKREESIQDVPISISAFSGDALDAQGVVEVRDLGKITPAVQFSDAVGFTMVFIRGVGSDAWLPSADPSVAVYIDGVYVPRTQGVVQEFGGLERVEVLKGPQGTLFGRNSTAGAVSIITKKPGANFEGDVQMELGNFGARRLKAYSSMPLTENMGFSVAGIYSSTDFQYDNINPGNEYDPEVARAGRVKFNWQISDDINLDITGLATSFNGHGSLASKNTKPSALSTALDIQPQADDYHGESDFQADIEGRQTALNGVLSWTLPRFDIKAIASDQTIGTDYTSYDFDASPQPLVAFDSPQQVTDQQTAEFQLISNDDTWGSDKLKWVLGAYYLKSATGYEPVVFRVAPKALQYLANPNNSLGIALPEALISKIEEIAETIPLSTPLTESGLEIPIDGRMKTKSMSGFFQGTYTFTDWLDLTLGGRYQEEKRTVVKSKSGLKLTDGAYVPITDFAPRSSSFSNFSPKAVISARPADGTMIYLSWAKGFKSATYNIVNLYQEPPYVKPEEVTAYELGMKADFFGGLLRLNSAIFQSNIKNLQSQFISLLSGGVVQLENAGEGRIRGAEFDALIIPMPESNPGLSVSANAAYLDATYTSYPNGSGFDPVTGLYRRNFDFSGNRIVRSPEWSGGLGFTQAIDVSENGDLEIGADLYFNSGFFYTPQNSSVAEEDAYMLINGRISYLYKPWGLRLTAFGKNLTDEKYHVAQFQSDFGNAVTLAYPLQYGVRVGLSF